MPGFLRTTLETLLFSSMFLALLSGAPHMRQVFSKGIQLSAARMNTLFSGDEEEVISAHGFVPLKRGNEGEKSENEFESEASSDKSDHGAGSILKVGKSQIWRFNLRSESPSRLRVKVIKTLIDLGVPSDAKGLGGVEAPGGIQMDLLVDSSQVQAIKQTLEKLAPPEDPVASTYSLRQSFAWFKNHSKKELPAGKSRVIIWLSQF